MALIRCPDCKKQISDSAAACPHCGCQFRYQYQKMRHLKRRIEEIESEEYPKEDLRSKKRGPFILTVGLVAAIASLCFAYSDHPAALLGLPGTALAFAAVMVGFEVSFVQPRMYKKKVEDFHRRKALLFEMKRELSELEEMFR